MVIKITLLLIIQLKVTNRIAMDYLSGVLLILILRLLRIKLLIRLNKELTLKINSKQLNLWLSYVRF